MRRALIRGGAVIVVCAAMLFGYLLYSSGSQVSGGKAYAEAAIVEITSSWSAPAMMDRASPSLAKSIDLAQMSDFFDFLARLGKRLNSGPCLGTATTTWIGLTGFQVTASYRCPAEFQEGPATITIELVKSGPSWLISSFNVQSAALLHLK